VTIDDDDPDNDPLMRSMRSVWLGMRDEEPSSNGLAELMAAARTQADAMRPKAAWWRRTLAVLVRPPVLAVATVLVIVGGAVVLGRHGVDDAALTTPTNRDESTIEEREHGAPGAGGAAGNEHAEPEARAVAPPTEAPATGDLPVAPAADPAPRHRPARVREHGDAFRRDGNNERAGDKKPDLSTDQRYTTGYEDDLAPPPPPPPPPAVDKDKVTVESGVAGGETSRIPTSGGVTDRRKIPRTLAPAAPSEPEAATLSSNRRPTDSTEQLIKQAQVAASRKDCPAVRATTQRIKKTAPAVYKSRVITQPEIARCLK